MSDNVKAVLEAHGRWAKLKADAELEAGIRRQFEQNGWVPEAGMTALETWREYARLASDDGVNSVAPFGKRYTRSEMVDAIASRTKLGTPRQVRQMLDLVDAADMHDGVLETLAQRDKSHAPVEKDTHATRQAALRDRVGDALDKVSFREEAHREARLETVQSLLPSTDEAPTLVEQVTAAMTALEEKT